MLEEHRKNCAKEQKFDEAELARTRIQELQAKQEAFRVEIRKKIHHEAVNLILRILPLEEANKECVSDNAGCGEQGMG